MERTRIGTVEVVALLDAPFLQNPRVLAPEHSDDLIAEYPDGVNERGLFTGAVTCYLLRPAGKNVLVDTGIGPRKRPGFPSGHLPEAMHQAGVTPSDIDIVIHTHLHVDHVGWNTYDTDDGRREVFFPNARFVVQQAEWDFWMTPEMLAEPRNAVLNECVEPLLDSGRLWFLQGEDTIDEHIVLISAPGHTPGHVAVGIAAGGERGVIIGDASYHPFNVVHPDWLTPTDWDPAMAGESRNRLYNLALEEQRLLMAGHWAHPGWGHVVKLDGKRTFRAL
jgi:glyoxylase-like metal-dependent hydrolase (beta-lactamase superfamily II)